MNCFFSHSSMVFSRSLLLIFVCGGSNTTILAQTKIKPSIQTTQMDEHYYKLYVHGFVNMLVFNGPDGALLVDSGCQPMDLIEAELKKIGADKIKFIINTHSHGDHVEGNALFGQDAVIISSQKCRETLLEDEKFPRSGLPNLTFLDSMSIHFNDEKINLYSMPGHSNNDIVVHFSKANIVCIGDFGFFKPFSDWPGLSANVYDMEKSMIWMTTRFSDKTRFILGHKNEYSMVDLKLNTEMVKEAIKLVSPMIQQGLDLDQIKKRNPLMESAFSMVRENPEHWIDNIFRDRKHSKMEQR